MFMAALLEVAGFRITYEAKHKRTSARKLAKSNTKHVMSGRIVEVFDSVEGNTGVSFKQANRESAVPLAENNVSAAQRGTDFLQEELPSPGIERHSSLAYVHRQSPSRLWKDIRELTRCDDSCAGANNGRCEDGTAQPPWPAESSPVRCDLGTDCTDCGAWKGQATKSMQAAAEESGLIERLQSEEVEVLVRSTACPPYFKFAHTNPKLDVDVSHMVYHGGVLEPLISFTWYKLLRERCRNRELVLDVGGNFGWYTVLAASLGCRVITWEPVPRFRAFLLYNVLLNGVGHLVEVRDTVVSDDRLPQSVVVPQRGIWGTAGINGMNIDPAVDNEGDYMKVLAVPERLDDVVSEKAVLLKVDVEGFEPSVLRTGTRLVTEKAVEHIFLEYSPGVGHRANNFTFAKEFPLMLHTLLKSGYNVRSFEAMEGFSAAKVDWDEHELPALEAVTDANIQYDLLDMENAINTRGQFACVYKPNAVKAFPTHANCGSIPEGLHPMSFHSVFSHNTNIWATLAAGDSFPKGATTGVLRPNEDERSYFTTRSSSLGMRGMGGRICDHLPPEVQVHHRCRCTNRAICGQEEEAVAQAYRSHGNFASDLIKQFQAA